MKAAIREKLNQALIREGDIPDPNDHEPEIRDVALEAMNPSPEIALPLIPRKPPRERVREVLVAWYDAGVKPRDLLRRKPQNLAELIAFLLVQNAMKSKPGTLQASRSYLDLRIALDGPDSVNKDGDVRGTVHLIESYNKDKPSENKTEVHKTVTFSGAPNRVQN